MTMFETSPILTYNRLSMTIATANEMAETYWACKRTAQKEPDKRLWANAYDEAKDSAHAAENSIRKLLNYYA